MSTTLLDITTLVKDRMRDTTTNSINMTTDGFRAITGTLQLWNQMHDWEFQVETATVNYNEGITRYALPSDYKAPIDMRFYKGSQRSEFDMVSQNNFNSESLRSRRFAISTVGQAPTLRLKAIGNRATLNPATGYNTNGTWVGASGAFNVGTDAYESYEQQASVSFDYSGTAGTLTNSTMSAADLTAYKNRSNLYFNIFMPTVTNLTSITLKWGTDGSNYYSSSITTDYLGNSFVASQWMKLKAPWTGATVTGTPTVSNIKYLQVTINYSSLAANSGYRMENFFFSENVPIIFEYYGQSLVKASSTGSKTQVFTNSANTTDLPLWSGQWDWVTESFVESVMEIIFWMTGEYEDKDRADKAVAVIVDNLKKRLPTRRRYAETFMKFDIN